MRLKNYTNIPSEKIREMKRFVKLKYSGVSKLNNITVHNCNYGYSGFFRGTTIYRMQEKRVFHMKPDEDELVVTVDPVIEKMEHTCIEVNISK
jgi:pyridoxal/pyridoxine/pyridoxamine kinase